MKCVLLVAGHAASLDQEIKADESGRYAHLEGVPKALMPSFGGKRILDHWWDLIKNRQLFSEVFLVTNADKFKHFERWATASDFPVDNIINDGTTSFESRLGAVADLDLCLRVKKVQGEDVVVIAGDMMFQSTLANVALCQSLFMKEKSPLSRNERWDMSFQDQRFDLNQLLNFRFSKPDGDVAMYYELDTWESASSRGMVEVCPFSNRILKFLEKPGEGQTKSRNASVVFYCLGASTLPMIQRYLCKFSAVEDRSFGKFLSWLVNEEERLVYGMKLPTGFQLIGQTSLRDYEAFLEYFARESSIGVKPKRITKRAYARVGLMGNPSDGFFGKTISLSIKNFWAEVTICPSSKLVLIPHPLCDPTEFGSLADLHCISSKEGYLGGLRLLQATCKKFYHYCLSRGIALAKRNFSLRYDTNIPRQVGLAGSSALVTAALSCLMDFFHVTEADLPKELRPQFILEVEVAELCINAGLQDRVVQVYEGLVYMDFSEELMKSQGHGNYEYLKQQRLPTLFLSYLADPSDSGKIHSDVRQRFVAGEAEVVDAMKTFAELTVKAKGAISEGDWKDLARLMSQNFELRRKVYGDECIGERNLRMVEIGSQFGAACKFPGSGGAIIGLLLEEERFEDMRRAYEDEGFVVTKVIPNM